MKRHHLAVMIVCAFLARAVPLWATVPCNVLIPVLGTAQSVIAVKAPDGNTYPVFRLAPVTKLVQEINDILESSFAQQVLKLDRYARNFMMSLDDQTLAPHAENEPWMPRRRKPPSQNWRAFLDNHVGELMSIDFFTVPTVTFRVLFVLIVLAHDRRRIVHFNVTDPSDC